mgnify:CR=1 FL=1
MAFDISATSSTGTSSSPFLTGQGSKAGSSSSDIKTSSEITFPDLGSKLKSDRYPRVSPAPSRIGRFRISRPNPDGIYITPIQYPEEC